VSHRPNPAEDDPAARATLQAAHDDPAAHAITTPEPPRGGAVEIRAISLDLDDTLWPVWPAIERAEEVLHDWLEKHAPTTAERFDTADLRVLRIQIAAEHPELAHDLSRLRLLSIERALRAAGDPLHLAEEAFAVFFDARQQVELFPDARAALEQLAAKLPIIAVTNGNADLQRIGLGQLFVDTVAAREFGHAKPDVRIFHEACRRLALPPAQVLHVGDDWAHDIEGAHDAGLPSAWVRRDTRKQKSPQGSRAAPWLTVDDLQGLATQLLGG